MLKDLNANFIKSYNIVINDLLTEWENYTGQVIPSLIADLYKNSISCKFLDRYFFNYLYTIYTEYYKDKHLKKN